MGVKIDIVGKKFNKLTVIEEMPKRAKNGGYLYLCLCDCGKETVVRSDSIQRGRIKSCGCYNLELFIKRTLKHGHNSGNISPEYTSWHCMIQRCTNPKNTGYPDYGGRGIEVCDRWMSFELFFEDMGNKPTPEHSLDRFPDVNGNYELSNYRLGKKTKNIRKRNSYYVKKG